MQERLLLNYILASLGRSPQEQFIAEIINRNIELEDELEGKFTAERLKRESDLKKLDNELFTLDLAVEDLLKQVKARDYEGMLRKEPSNKHLNEIGVHLVPILKNAEALAQQNAALLRFKERIETIVESSSIDGNKVSLIIDEATNLRRNLRALQ